MGLSVERKVGDEIYECPYNLAGKVVISSRKSAGIRGCSGVVNTEENNRDEFRIRCNSCEHYIENLEKVVADFGEGSELAQTMPLPE